MNREELLKAFREMSPEDQDTIRAELTSKGEPGTMGNPMAMCMEMMEKLKGGGDPMTCCKEMMEKLGGKSSARTSSGGEATSNKGCCPP